MQGLLDLPEDQIVDLMHLRRLYLTKRGLLAMERQQLVSSIASFNNQLVHPSDNSAAAVDVAAALKENAFEDQEVLYRVARAVWCGVSHHLLCMCMPCHGHMVSCGYHMASRMLQHHMACGQVAWHINCHLAVMQYCC